MGFINYPSPTPIFPVIQSQGYSTHKKPSYYTNTEVSVSGREYQIARQVVPRWEFDLTFGGDAWMRDQTQNQQIYTPLSGFTEFEQICGLFLACLGSYGEFYYSDPDDNSRSGQSLGSAVSGTLSYQFFFTWGTGPLTPSASFPVTGINTIDAVYLNGVVQAPGSYGLDSTRTKLVFTSQPTVGATITADFSFYFRCRFLNDMEQFNQWAKNLWENKSLKFRSVKP